MKYYLLANPNSGSGKGARTLEILLPYLEEHEFDYQLYTTKKFQNHTSNEAALVYKILTQKTKEDRLVIIGGDGTLSLVINELPASESFSYIPSGSGNDFARSLNLSLDPIEAFEAARQRTQPHEIYVMRYQSKDLSGYSLNNIGIGLDATIVQAANGGKLKNVLNRLKLGSLSYVATALQVLITKKSFGTVITSGEEVLEKNKAFLMTFTKHPYFGGGVKISPTASNKNSEIHLVEYDKHRLLRTFSLIPSVLKGTHLQHPLFLHKVRKYFTVKLSEEQPVQIDGEIYHLQAGEILSIQPEKRKIFY
ncbi:diacylglycerol/lipid kinase family protein [Lactococcus taiwanensis]|uniref:diacylglycerol/lipid kinase family protein n=1 Tax=Lactococcus taiwanensis TaxID=1151742 RepID=UPI003D11C998